MITSGEWTNQQAYIIDLESFVLAFLVGVVVDGLDIGQLRAMLYQYLNQRLLQFFAQSPFENTCKLSATQSGNGNQCFFALSFGNAIGIV